MALSNWPWRLSSTKAANRDHRCHADHLVFLLALFPLTCWGLFLLLCHDGRLAVAAQSRLTHSDVQAVQSQRMLTGIFSAKITKTLPSNFFSLFLIHKVKSTANIVWQVTSVWMERSSQNHSCEKTPLSPWPHVIRVGLEVKVGLK